MKTSETEKFPAVISVELGLEPHALADRQDPDLLLVADAVTEVLRSQSELRGAIQRRKTLYALSEFLVTECEAVEGKATDALRTVYQALPESIRGLFASLDAFLEFSEVDLDLITVRIEQSKLETVA